VEVPLKALLKEGLALAALALATLPVFAFGHLPKVCPAPCPEVCPPPPPPPIVWEERTITTYKPEVKTRKVETVVTELATREVKTPTVRTVWETVYNDTKEVRTVIELVPRPSVKKVMSYKMVPCTTVDPCTGCPKTTYHPEPYEQEIPCTVYDSVPVKKEVLVTRGCLKPVKKVFDVVQLVPELKPVKKVYQVESTVMVPQVFVIKVPVCVPCPAACP
jgi:hypothetical protein